MPFIFCLILPAWSPVKLFTIECTCALYCWRSRLSFRMDNKTGRDICLIFEKPRWNLWQLCPCSTCDVVKGALELRFIPLKIYWRQSAWTEIYIFGMSQRLENFSIGNVLQVFHILVHYSNLLWKIGKPLQKPMDHSISFCIQCLYPAEFLAGDYLVNQDSKSCIVDK